MKRCRGVNCDAQRWRAGEAISRFNLFYEWNVFVGHHSANTRELIKVRSRSQ